METTHTYLPHDINWSAQWGAWIEDTYDPDAPPVVLPDRLEDMEL